MSDAARRQRALQLVAGRRVRLQRGVWTVGSQSGRGSYVVDPRDWSCNCPDWEEGHTCKHCVAVQITLTGLNVPDAPAVANTVLALPHGDPNAGCSVIDPAPSTPTPSPAKKPTYKQDWPVYNAAQTEEKFVFLKLLRELCDLVEQRPQERGRPRVDLRDLIFCSVMKIYLTRSGRRVTADLAELLERGLLRNRTKRPPHYNTISRYLGLAFLTDVLETLIEKSVRPLRLVETNFAADATGFGTSTYSRWQDDKNGYGSKGSKVYLKVHAAVGVRTHIVSAVAVTLGSEPDSKQLVHLVHRTIAAGCTPAEVSADKAYLSSENLERVCATGANPYIPFKVNSRPDGSRAEGSSVWRRLYDYYQYRYLDFLQHYHKRSNVETAFSMIKRKFGGNLRSKVFVAQQNELLLKILAHNLCCLAMSMRELGIVCEFFPRTHEPESPGPSSPPLDGVGPTSLPTLVGSPSRLTPTDDDPKSTSPPDSPESPRLPPGTSPPRCSPEPPSSVLGWDSDGEPPCAPC